MTTITVSIAAERFGEEGKKSLGPFSTKNQRAVKIQNISREMKTLKSQHKVAGDEEHVVLAQLMYILRKKIRVLRLAAWYQWK